jgi:hypothetical protein
MLFWSVEAFASAFVSFVEQILWATKKRVATMTIHSNINSPTAAKSLWYSYAE